MLLLRLYANKRSISPVSIDSVAPLRKIIHPVYRVQTPPCSLAHLAGMLLDIKWNIRPLCGYFKQNPINSR